jgi:TonB family protein
MPVMPAPMLSLDTPAPPSINTRTVSQASMPVFAASAPPQIAAAPVKVRPAPAIPVRVKKPDGGGTRIGTSRGPMVIKPPNLADYYPRRARMRGITGKSSIRLSIDDNGRVTNVEISSSWPEGTFETAAGRVGKSLRFRPAIRDGRPVATKISLNLVWNLE